MSGTMHAIRQQAFGGPEVLELAEVQRPVPLPTEVLVRVRAVGVNPVETVIRSGRFPLLGEPPFILGWDISGVVEDIEPGVTRFQPGDEVYGMPFFPRAARAYAEYVAAPSRQLARKPAGLSHAEAAGLPLAGLTAWQALVDTAQVAAGQRVLIHGAGGGLGHLAVQIARARGADVIGTASAAKHDFVASLGAELIDYRATDFAAHVDGVDVVLDTIGGDIARRSVGVLRPGGLLVTIVGRRDVALAARTEAAGRRFAGVSVEPDYPALEALAALADSGQLRVHLQATLGLAEAVKAHELLESGSVTGKIALTV